MIKQRRKQKGLVDIQSNAYGNFSSTAKYSQMNLKKTYEYTAAATSYVSHSFMQFEY